jgi:Na+/proline symporter
MVGTLTIPGLLIPVVTTYFEKLTPTPKVAFITMLSGFIFSFTSFVLGQIFKTPDGNPAHPFGLEPMFPGLIASIAVYAAGKLRKNLFFKHKNVIFTSKKLKT